VDWLESGFLTTLGVGFAEGIVGDLVQGIIGAVAILLVAGLFKK